MQRISPSLAAYAGCLAENPYHPFIPRQNPHNP